jgi:hypothetical protein
LNEVATIVGRSGSFRHRSAAGLRIVLAALAVAMVVPLATNSFGVEAPATGEGAAAIAELRTALDQANFRLALLEARDASSESGDGAPTADVRSVALTVGLISLRERSRTDQPFATELDLVRPLVARAPGGDAAVASLLAYADAGVPSVADLALELGRLEPLLTAQINASGPGGKLVRSMLATVHLARAAEPDPRLATVEQIRVDLSRGRLDLAVAAVEKLDPPTRSIASGWLAAAQIRLALDRNMESLVQGALTAMLAAP